MQNKTVTPEDSVSFTCSFSHFFDVDANIDIEWEVDDSNDIIDTLCEEDSCFITTTEGPTTTSTLTIDGNSLLSIGTHDIKCTASVGDNMLTSSAVLTIQQAGIIIHNSKVFSRLRFKAHACNHFAAPPYI